MKKIISIATALAISSALLVGCSSNDDLALNDDRIEDDIVDDMDMFEDRNDNIDNEIMYKDGIYKSEFNGYSDGYKDYVELTIKDGKIDKVVHDGTDENGMLKSEDEAVKSRYLEKYETYPAEFMPIYSTHLLDNQSLDMIETHKGTDLEKTNFVRLAEETLLRAKDGNTETSSIDLMN